MMVHHHHYVSSELVNRTSKSLNLQQALMQVQAGKRVKRFEFGIWEARQYSACCALGCLLDPWRTELAV